MSISLAAFFLMVLIEILIKGGSSLNLIAKIKQVRLSAIFAVYLFTLTFILCGCKNAFLFYPYKYLVATPAEIGLAYEDVSFTTDDKIDLKGWWVPAKGTRGTVLFCHGNGGNISFLLDTIRIFHSLDLAVLVFDYRGYGASAGTPTEEGTYLDARAAWRYLLNIKKITPDKIILIGRSLGGSIAAWLCQECRPRVLVLESTFTKAADVADYHYLVSPGKLVFGNTYNTEEYITRIACPVYIVHSPDDEIIPYEQGRRLYQLARFPKEFLTIRGSHNTGFLDSREEYINGLHGFLVKYFSKPL